MARNINQSTQGFSTTVASDCPIRWDTSLKIKLAKLKQPTLIQALEKVGQCSCHQFMWLSEFVENGRANPHEFTEASYPMDMSAIYDAYEQYAMDVSEKAVGSSDFLPTLSGYIAWLVVSKLWRLCDSATNSARPVYTPATVMEISNICLLAEHAERLLRSEDRAIAASRPLNLIWMKAGKEAKRKRVKFWEKAEKSFYEWYSRDRDMYLSLEAAAMAISETEALPFDFFRCYQMAQSVEEKI